MDVGKGVQDRAGDEGEGVADPSGGSGVWTVLTTTDAALKAQLLARGAVDARLAACAQISAPVTSVYRWEGRIETSEEWQILFKTTAERYPLLQEWLQEAHDYETPEIIATPVAAGSAAYLDWVRRETSA
ncbi:divalent cation tolerance protein [Streptomyces indicus]|uniref:Divalent cation tolerance protein n=1 Tax=Streptomyces indicus TaxID=417292 RepID=A0A1G9D7B6_9ACTN|nr:divalent cation tolerance protein [Streptomyces indicus]